MNRDSWATGGGSAAGLSAPGVPFGRLWAARGFFGGVAAIVLALIGQRALLVGHASAAGWYYGFAIAILLAALLSTPGNGLEWGPSPKKTEQTEESFVSLGQLRRPGPLWFGLGTSLAMVGAASVLVWLHPDGRQVASAILWGAALLILLFLFPGGQATRTDRKRFLRGPDDDAFSPGIPRPRPDWESLLVATMLLFAGALRLFQLESHPGLFGDEAEQGLNARAILQGQPAPFFGYGWWGVPNLYFYTVAATMRIFGDGIFGLRMLSVLSGLAAVFFIYRTGRLLWGPRAGLLAGMFLAVSPLALQFSRFGSVSTPTATLWAAGFFFLFRSLRFGGPRNAILSGISFGLSLYLYPSGKLVFALLPALFAYTLLLGPRRFIRELAFRLGLLFFAFLLTFLPYGVASFRDGWKAFAGRYQERSILSPQNRAEAFSQANLPYEPAWQTESLARSLFRHPFAWGRVLFTQIGRTVAVLYGRGDSTAFFSTREHRGSMLSPLMAALTILGLAYAAFKAGDARFGVSSIWFWGGLLGTALTLDTPSVQRLVGAYPAVTLFPAVVLDRVTAASWPLNIRFARRWVAIILMFLIAYVSREGIREYFVHYRSLAPFGEATAQARYVEALGNDYKVYQFGLGGKNEPEVYFGYGPTRFLAPGVEGVDVTALANFLPVTDNGGKGAAFLVYPWSAEYLPILKLFYPGGNEEIVRSTNGAPRFTSYKLSAAKMRRFQTLRATYRQRNGVSIERREPNLGTARTASAFERPWRAPEQILYPVIATWAGSIVAPAYGRYVFTLTGAGDGELWIDGRSIARESDLSQHSAGPRRAELILAKGLHDVRLTGSLPHPETRIVVTRAYEAEESKAMESRFLFESPAGGLSGEVWRGVEGDILSPPERMSPAIRRVDPVFGFREALNDPTFGRGPFVARWHGSINAARAGEYRFETRSNGGCALRIDGRPVLSTPSGGMPSGAVTLKTGKHRVELLYRWKEGRGRLDLYWTTPKGRRELVPPTVLSPDQRSWSPAELRSAAIGASKASETGPL